VLRTNNKMSSATIHKVMIMDAVSVVPKEKVTIEKYFSYEIHISPLTKGSGHVSCRVFTPEGLTLGFRSNLSDAKQMILQYGKFKRTNFRSKN
jgi:hypothetical protein